jgi:hypothetical protein
MDGERSLSMVVVFREDGCCFRWSMSVDIALCPEDGTSFANLYAYAHHTLSCEEYGENRIQGLRRRPRRTGCGDSAACPPQWGEWERLLEDRLCSLHTAVEGSPQQTFLLGARRREKQTGWGGKNAGFTVACRFFRLFTGSMGQTKSEHRLCKRAPESTTLQSIQGLSFLS